MRLLIAAVLLASVILIAGCTSQSVGSITAGEEGIIKIADTAKNVGCSIVRNVTTVWSSDSDCRTYCEIVKATGYKTTPRDDGRIACSCIDACS